MSQDTLEQPNHHTEIHLKQAYNVLLLSPALYSSHAIAQDISSVCPDLATYVMPAEIQGKLKVAASSYNNIVLPSLHPYKNYTDPTDTLCYLNFSYSTSDHI